MLVIDRDTERKMIHTLETLRIESEPARCVHFKARSNSADVPLKDMLLNAVERCTPQLQARLFCCEDGDLFVVAPEISTKKARQLMLDMGNQLGIPADDELASIYELDLHVQKVMLLVEEKIEKRRQLQQTMQRQAQEQEAERRRNAILSSVALTEKISDIAKRRQERPTAELMIIEDDPFSRRLVERVMQKLVTINSLGSAELALDTYTRVAPDIVFLDINLPDVTGHELLEKFLELDPQAYIIMLSGNADRTNITAAMERGAKGFIAKPFTTEKLLQYIDRCPTIRAKRATHATA